MHSRQDPPTRADLALRYRGRAIWISRQRLTAAGDERASADADVVEPSANGLADPLWCLGAELLAHYLEIASGHDEQTELA